MKQSVIHWNEINMRAKVKNLPAPRTRCLICIPGKLLETALFFNSSPGNPFFLRGNEVIKPVTGMLWIPASQIIRKEAAS